MSYSLIGSPVVPVCYETRWNVFRSYLLGASNLGGTSVVYWNVAKNCNQIRFLFTNFFDANGIAGDSYTPGTTGPITVMGSMEDPLNIGTPFVQLTFNGGAPSAVLAYGGSLWSDPVDYELLAGMTVPLRTYIQGVSGAYIPCMSVMTPQNLYVTNVGNTYGYNGADVSTYGNNYVTDGGNGSNQLATVGRAWVVSEVQPESYTASAVMGQLTVGSPAQPVVGVVGDSLSMGYSDYGNGELGWVMRQLRANKILSLNFSAVAETMQSASIPLSYRIRKNLSQFCTHAILEYGVNDFFTAGWSEAQVKGYAVIVAQWLVNRGIKVYICTITPSTTSTDSYVTAGNQTPRAGDAQKQIYNSLLRSFYTNTASQNAADSLLSLISGVIDVAATIEVNATNVLTLNGGRWYCGPANNTAYVLAGDGVHALANANILMAPAINTSLFVAPVGTRTDYLNGVAYTHPV